MSVDEENAIEFLVKRQEFMGTYRTQLEENIDRVLNLIKKQQEEIERLTKQSKNLDKQAQQYFETTIIQAQKFDEEIEKKDKIINEMADEIINGIYKFKTKKQILDYFTKKVGKDNE